MRHIQGIPLAVEADVTFIDCEGKRSVATVRFDFSHEGLLQLAARAACNQTKISRDGPIKVTARNVRPA